MGGRRCRRASRDFGDFKFAFGVDAASRLCCDCQSRSQWLPIEMDPFLRPTVEKRKRLAPVERVPRYVFLAPAKHETSLPSTQIRYSDSAELRGDGWAQHVKASLLQLGLAHRMLQVAIVRFLRRLVVVFRRVVRRLNAVQRQTARPSACPPLRQCGARRSECSHRNPRCC